MEMVGLGKSGIRISRMGIGAWQASSAWGAKDEDVVRAISRAHELGINLVDTAETYGEGHSEGVVGRAIKEIGRDDMVVATKVHGANLRYEELQKACRRSLERLGVKEIDLYQVHWPDPWEQIPLKQTMSALEKLHGQGKIRAIGVSNFAVRDLEEARSCLSKAEIVSNQVRYNVLQRNVQEEVLPYCRKNDIRVLAWSPLAQGALSGKYGVDNRPEGGVRDKNSLFTKPNMKQIEKMLRVLRDIASGRGRTVPQVALNWLVRDELVTPIPGAKDPTQSEENVGAVGWRLTDTEFERIEKAYASISLDYLA